MALGGGDIAVPGAGAAEGRGAVLFWCFEGLASGWTVAVDRTRARDYALGNPAVYAPAI